jgi:predicted secreted Zn-dependent protease
MPMSMDDPTCPVNWQKAHRSAHNGECVEVAVEKMVAVRDSKNPTGPVLRYTSEEWNAFVEGVKNGEFDDLI